MTQSVHDFETVRDQFESYGPTLRSDINLPKYDGYYWCRQFRPPPARLSSSPPVTGNGSGDGLENGADDYITKPFDYEIAMAKIKSQLRRATALCCRTE